MHRHICISVDCIPRSVVREFRVVHILAFSFPKCFLPTYTPIRDIREFQISSENQFLALIFSIVCFYLLP